VQAVEEEAVRICVTKKVNPSEEVRELVLFTSPVGSSRGRWMGPAPACLGGAYDVELDFPDEVWAFELLAAGSEERIDWSMACLAGGGGRKGSP
jgi:hypothetical protein